MLESLQRQMGSPTGVVAPQLQTTAPAPTGEARLSTGQVDTTEEQEVRRAQARKRLRELYDPTPLEADFRRRLGDGQLRQFGYDFLQSAPAPTGVRTGAIGDDYVLGIGDSLQISFRGASSQNFSAQVDRDGRLIVDKLRPVQAAGRSLGAVRAEIVAETRRTMLATDVFVTVGDVRAVSIFVGGEVVRPGQFALTSIADIGTAIAQAGGIRRSGSLRQVRVVRAGGGSVTVDLYGLLGIGTPPNVRLRDGDRIIVPVIGPTVAVSGAVARPGIYELRGSTSVGAVVAFAGGALRQRGAQVVLARIGADGTETFIRAASAALPVQSGDAVQLFGNSAGGASGRVLLLGHVDNPGVRPLMSAGTIGELVGSVEDLKPDTYQLAAILVRRDASSGGRTYQMVNLAHELRERFGTSLQSEDRLYILSRADIAFMNSAPVRQIIIGQPNPLRGCVPLEAFARLVRDAQGRRFSAVTRSGFVVSTARGATTLSTSAAIEDGVTRSIDGAGGRSAAQEDPSCPGTFVSDPELLPVLIEYSVSVGGAVRRPGAYPVAGAVSARDLAFAADGIVAGAQEVVLNINRQRPGAPERVDLQSGEQTLASVTLMPGDDLRFNAESGSFEGSGVLLSGEVRRPGLYAIRKGEKLSDLIARAGGLTDQAYAFGAVFTRDSVRRSQEEGFRRTARELYNGLLAISARSDKGTDGLAGAAALISALSSAEAPGRVVIEADPRVLELRPDLDTVLEGGDNLFVPKRPNFVLALGDVNNPGALQFAPDRRAADYVRQAGGITRTADSGRVFVVLPNGTAEPVSMGGWGGGGGISPPPGSTIIVPKNIDPLFRLTVVRDITTIIAQLATSVATVAVLATR